MVKLLAVGDVFGDPGRKMVTTHLPRLRDELGAGLVIVNVENMHNGRGADAAGVRAILDAGADCLTSGNHIWSHKEHERLLERETRLLRPANYPEPCPGQGVTVVSSREGARVGVINLIGRLFMVPVDDPFRIADEIIAALAGKTDLIALDFHAEATSEKQALASYLDGRVAAIWGTHTHVQTADARVLPQGTGYITDLGMTGPYDSVIGMDRQPAIARFLTSRGARSIPAAQEAGLRGALFDLDESTGRCLAVTRIALGGGGS